MKYLAIFFLVVLISVQILGEQGYNEENFEFTSASRSYSSKLRQALDVDLRNLMQNGDASRNVPVLDPLEQQEAALEFHNELGDVNLYFRDLYSHDLSMYIVREASVSVWSRKANIGLTFPNVYVDGNYSGKAAVLGDLDAFGEGEFKATVGDLKIDAEIGFSILGGIKVKYVNLKIVLGKLHFEATGLFNDDDSSVQFSQDVSDQAPQYISKHHSEITNFLSKYLLQTANKYLSKNRISEIDEIFV